MLRHLILAPAVAALAGSGCNHHQTKAETRPQDAPAHMSAPAPCRAADLTTRLFFQGATSSALGGFVVRDAKRSCSLGGRPTVRVFRSSGEWAAVRQEPAGMPDGFSRVRVLRKSQAATLPLQWWNYCGPHRAGAFRFQVTLTGGATVAANERGAPTCLTKRLRSTVLVSQFGRVAP